MSTTGEGSDTWHAIRYSGRASGPVPTAPGVAFRELRGATSFFRLWCCLSLLRETRWYAPRKRDCQYPVGVSFPTMILGRLGLLYDRRPNGKRSFRIEWRRDAIRVHVFAVSWW